jgi:hypothetical protein
VALVKMEVAEERIACIIRVTRIGELDTTLAVTSNPNTLRRNTTVLQFLVIANGVSRSLVFLTLIMETILFSETPVLT